MRPMEVNLVHPDREDQVQVQVEQEGRPSQALAPVLRLVFEKQREELSVRERLAAPVGCLMQVR